MLKRWLASLLSLILVIGILAPRALAVETGNDSTQESPSDTTEETKYEPVVVDDVYYVTPTETTPEGNPTGPAEVEKTENGNIPDPSKETSDSTTPSGESDTSTEESSTPTEESSTPTEESSTPTEESSTPTEESSTPTEESSTPTEESSTPTEESSTPTTDAGTSTEGGDESTGTESAGDPTYDELVRDFMESLAITSNFVVYADDYYTGMHIDGNIATNTLHGGIETVKPQRPAGQDTYSFIGEGVENNRSESGYDTKGSEPTIGVIDPNVGGDGEKTVVISGDGSVSATNINGDSQMVKWTTSTDPTEKNAHIIATENADGSTSYELTDKGKEALEQINTDTGSTIDPNRFQQEIQIDQNLAAISSTAAALNNAAMEAADSGLTSTNAAAVQAVQTFVNEAKSKDENLAGSVITITLTAEELNKADNLLIQNDLAQLFSNTAGTNATILLNIDTRSAGASITINSPIGAVDGNFSAQNAKYVWNFGSYDGTVQTEKSFVGIIVAPNATVHIHGTTVEARIIADTAVQNANAEIHQPREPAKETTAPTTAPTSEPTTAPTSEPTTETTVETTPETTTDPTDPNETTSSTTVTTDPGDPGETTDPGDPGETTKPGRPTSSTGPNPKTGDAMVWMFAIFALFGVSLILMIQLCGRLRYHGRYE